LVRAAHIHRLFVQVNGKIETSPRACRAALPRDRKHRQFHQRTVKRDRPIRLLNGVGDRAEADLVPAAAPDLYLGEPAQHRLTALVLQGPRQQVRNLAGSDQAGVPACDHIPLVFGRRDHRAPAEPAKDLGDIGTAALSQSLQRPERNVDTQFIRVRGRERGRACVVEFQRVPRNHEHTKKLRHPGTRARQPGPSQAELEQPLVTDWRIGEKP
jgi:hypothetical protein